MICKISSNPNHCMIQWPRSIHRDLVGNNSVHRCNSTNMTVTNSTPKVYFCISPEYFFITSEKKQTKASKYFVKKNCEVLFGQSLFKNFD